jgi:glycosyltransferase involved in cell wall biosynthesis
MHEIRGLVSTIIPVYNRAGMLREAVESVLAQTYRPIEIIIVDDGSTDESASTADELARAHDAIFVVHQPNRGPGAAREAGRLRARGVYIQYLDSDDLLMPSKFEYQVAGLSAARGSGASYGWTRLRLADGASVAEPWKRTGERIESMFPSFLQSRWWDTSTPLYRRELIDCAGPWLETSTEEDWEYDARIASLGVRLHYCDTWVSETRLLDPYRASVQRGPAVLRDRAISHQLIYGHAKRGGVGDETPEMRHFARELFLLSRQCGAAGLPQVSATLFKLAREASGRERNRLQFRVYDKVAGLLGWGIAGRLAALSDLFRR